MTPDFMTVLDIMGQEVNSINPGRIFLTSEAFTRNRDSASNVYHYLSPLMDKFIQVVAGNSPGSSMGVVKFSGETMNFTRRLLKKPSLNLLEPAVQEQALGIIAHCFTLGLLYHLFYFNYRSREQLSRVKLEQLAEEWLPKTTVASVVLRNYYKKENHGSARLLFEHYFNHTLEPNLKPLGLGFWKRGKAHFFLLNLFLAGSLLGMEFDLMTAK